MYVIPDNDLKGANCTIVGDHLYVSLAIYTIYDKLSYDKKQQDVFLCKVLNGENTNVVC